MFWPYLVLVTQQQGAPTGGSEFRRVQPGGWTAGEAGAAWRAGPAGERSAVPGHRPQSLPARCGTFLSLPVGERTHSFFTPVQDTWPVYGNLEDVLARGLLGGQEKEVCVNVSSAQGRCHRCWVPRPLGPHFSSEVQVGLDQPRGSYQPCCSVTCSPVCFQMLAPFSSWFLEAPMADPGEAEAPAPPFALAAPCLSAWPCCPPL